MNWFQSFWRSLTGAATDPARVPVHVQTGSGPRSAPTQRQSSDETIGSFTPRAQQVLALAHREADRFRHKFIGSEHLLLGLIKLGQGVAVNVLQKMGLDLETVRKAVEKRTGTGPDQMVISNIPYTPRVKKVLALASKEARALNHTYVGTEHILLGLLREGDGIAAQVLKDLNVNIEQTRQEILKELDPNLLYAADGPNPRFQVRTPKSELPSSSPPPGDSVDLSKRYDVHCTDWSQGVTIHRNVRFKGVRHLFPKSQYDALSGFVELEHADSQTLLVARSSILQFGEHDATPGPGPDPDPKAT